MVYTTHDLTVEVRDYYPKGLHLILHCYIGLSWRSSPTTVNSNRTFAFGLFERTVATIFASFTVIVSYTWFIAAYAIFAASGVFIAVPAIFTLLSLAEAYEFVNKPGDFKFVREPELRHIPRHSPLIKQLAVIRRRRWFDLVWNYGGTKSYFGKSRPGARYILQRVFLYSVGVNMLTINCILIGLGVHRQKSVTKYLHTQTHSNSHRRRVGYYMGEWRIG